MKKRSLFPALLFCALLCWTCQPEPRPVEPPEVPAWSQEAIWYQIFVERFRNGDPSNDPKPVDMEGGYPEYLPPSWTVTPWGHDWYDPEPWQAECRVDGFYPRVQGRRYGGDLQGVLDKIDYIAALGVNAVYFNPLNDAPSLHKYDARNYHHIDRNFGPDPYADEVLIDSETPSDPNTWQWTKADQLFLDLIKAFHDRGIRVIMDYSWNHTGTEFWALKEVHQTGPDSPFSNWYHILKYDDPTTPEDEFEYEGWAGFKGLPVFEKDIYPPDDKVMPFEGNLSSESLKQHIFNVSRRWLDPNGDGDPGDGVDGFRLDVAAEVPMGFWREYRSFVRSINPEAYLVGEVWWLDWPDSLLDPQPFLQGDQFDAVMNYRWYRLARGLFGQCEPVVGPEEFVRQLAIQNEGIRPDYQRAMMNVAASHDSPRLNTSLFNKTKYKYNAKPNDNPDYKIHKPDARTRREQELLLLHQFTFPGAPHIWNGDEVGMWGADDPDCRKPMVWDDLEYDVEKAHFFPGRERPVDTVRVDSELLNYYKSLTVLRRENPGLALGDLEFLVADDATRTLAYRRTGAGEDIFVAFNLSDEPQTLSIHVGKREELIAIFPGSENTYIPVDEILTLELGGMEGIVLK